MTHSSRSLSVLQTARRRFLKAGVASSTLGLSGWVHAQSGPKIRIGYWPIAAGLPFYSALELGYFKEAGVNVEAQRFAGAQQIMEGMLSDRTDGSANGTGSANIAIGELAAPGTFKIICSNPSNVKNVLDEMLVPINSTAKVMADLKGKRIGVYSLSSGTRQNLQVLLHQAGLSESDVTVVVTGLLNFAPLMQGQVDATAATDTGLLMGRQRGLGEVNVMEVRSREGFDPVCNQRHSTSVDFPSERTQPRLRAGRFALVRQPRNRLVL